MWNYGTSARYERIVPVDDRPSSRLNSAALTLRQEDFCSQILYVLTLLLSKTAVLCLYLRLSPRSQDHVASLVTLGVSGMWALASIVLIALPCNPLDFWIGGPERCPNIVSPSFHRRPSSF